MKGTHWLDNLLHSLCTPKSHIMACLRRILVIMIQEAHQRGLGMDEVDEHVVRMTSFFPNNGSLESPERPDDLASWLGIV